MHAKRLISSLLLSAAFIAPALAAPRAAPPKYPALPPRVIEAQEEHLARLLKAPGGGEVDIAKARTQNMSCLNGTCTPTAPNAVLNVNDLVKLLRAGSVTVNTTADAPNIAVDAGFDMASGNGLTLEAIGNIVVNKGIVVERDPGPTGFQLVYNATGGGGTLSFGGKGSIVFWDLTSQLFINGQSYILAGDVQSLSQLIQRNPGGNFALANRYNAKNDGRYTQSPIPVLFQGNFEGLGNSISNLHVEMDDTGQSQFVGFFQQTAQSAYVGNLKLAGIILNVTVDVPTGGWGATDVGGLVGDNQGTLNGITVSGSVATSCPVQLNNSALLGGLAGSNEGTIGFANTNLTVTQGNGCFGGFSGELAGGSWGSILFSSANGSVIAAGPEVPGTAYGGLVGFNSGVLGYSNSHASVSAPAGSNAGGAVGSDSGPVTNTLSYGTVAAGTGSYIGGFVGFDGSSGQMANDSWDMTTSGITDPSQGAGNIPNDPGITGFN